MPPTLPCAKSPPLPTAVSNVSNVLVASTPTKLQAISASELVSEERVVRAQPFAPSGCEEIFQAK